MRIFKFIDSLSNNSEKIYTFFCSFLLEKKWVCYFFKDGKLLSENSLLLGRSHLILTSNLKDIRFVNNSIEIAHFLYFVQTYSFLNIFGEYLRHTLVFPVLLDFFISFLQNICIVSSRNK